MLVARAAIPSVMFNWTACAVRTTMVGTPVWTFSYAVTTAITHASTPHPSTTDEATFIAAVCDTYDEVERWLAKRDGGIIGLPAEPYTAIRNQARTVYRTQTTPSPVQARERDPNSQATPRPSRRRTSHRRANRGRARWSSRWD